MSPRPPPAPGRRVLKVLVEMARDLPLVADDQRPYVVLTVGATCVRTRPAASGRPAAANPAWRTAHKFELAGGEELMAVAVKDERTREVIGEALIDLSRVLACGRDCSGTPLTTPAGRTQGFLLFRLRVRGIESAPALPQCGGHGLKHSYGAAGAPQSSAVPVPPAGLAFAAAREGMRALRAEVAALLRGDATAADAAAGAYDDWAGSDNADGASGHDSGCDTTAGPVGGLRAAAAAAGKAADRYEPPSSSLASSLSPSPPPSLQPPSPPASADGGAGGSAAARRSGSSWGSPGGGGAVARPRCITAGVAGDMAEAAADDDPALAAVQQALALEALLQEKRELEDELRAAKRALAAAAAAQFREDAAAARARRGGIEGAGAAAPAAALDAAAPAACAGGGRLRRLYAA